MATLVPLPLMASDGHAPSKDKQATQASLKQVVAQEAARTPLKASAARTAAQDNPSKQSTAFFKSRPGMIALAVMVVGTGYAIYSASHDRIHSPGKK